MAVSRAARIGRYARRRAEASISRMRQRVGQAGSGIAGHDLPVQWIPSPLALKQQPQRTRIDSSSVRSVASPPAERTGEGAGGLAAGRGARALEAVAAQAREGARGSGAPEQAGVGGALRASGPTAGAAGERWPRGVGAMAVVARGGGAARARRGAAGERENARALAGGREVTDPWLRRMLDEKPRKVVAVGTCQQDGAHHLGRDASQMSGANERWLDPKPRGGKRGDRRGLTTLDHPNGRELGRSQLESAGRTADKVGANGRQDGVGRTSIAARACEPAYPIWIRSHEHHTGPRPEVPHQEAEDTTVPDLSVTNPLFEVRLANQGGVQIRRDRGTRQHLLPGSLRAHDPLRATLPAGHGRTRAWSPSLRGYRKRHGPPRPRGRTHPLEPDQQG